MPHRQSPGMFPSPDVANEQARTRTPEAASPPQQRRLASLFGALVILFMIAIVVLPLLYTSFSDELGRWHLAAAWEQRLDGNLEAAIKSLNSALELAPDHVEMHLQRAAWYDELGNREAALRDYNKVSELADNDSRMLLGRAMTYHRMGKPDASIRDLQQLLEASSGTSRAAALNTLAYFRALNNIDLDQALSDVDKSIDLLGPSPALLDTRGFIHYQLGEFQAARSDLENAVNGIGGDLESTRRGQDGRKMGVVDLRVHQLQIRAAREQVAVVVYHRGLIYEKLGEAERAQADFAKVRELGFEPGPELY